MENKTNLSKSGNGKTFNPTDSSRQKSSANKVWPRGSRRRENNHAPRSGNRTVQPPAAKARSNVDKRPRPRASGNNCSIGRENDFAQNTYNERASSGAGLASGSDFDCTAFGDEAAGYSTSTRENDINSVYSPGTKKQSLNHLLNFYYTPRELNYYDGLGAGYQGVQRQASSYVKKHKYNKEQFIQANFQFVIKASAKRKPYDCPDTLIDWAVIEQINIQTAEEPQCPICLYPPVAAKITRCGHVYCWACVLHYLSLSDKSWRKCPICYDALHVGDLKSAQIVQQQMFSTGSQITLRLMRRKKGSLFIEGYEHWNNELKSERFLFVSSPLEEKRFSKFILATRADIADILTREQRELIRQLDESCPENVFVQQALSLILERSQKMSDVITYDSDTAAYKMREVLPPTKQSADGVVSYPDDKSENSGAEVTSSQCVPVLVGHGTTNSSVTKFYYFYQSDDGQNIFLHPMNVKMLQASYGSLADAPPVIKATILQKEQHSMDEEHRRKFTCLAHLPLTCEFSVVEVDLKPPYVNEDTMHIFKADILQRRKHRERKAREEHDREIYINAINDRQMGKLISRTANLNITSSNEFPECGFIPSLTSEPSLSENPSTSNVHGKKGSEFATNSSYSSIAINCQQEHLPWTTLNACQLQKPRQVEEMPMEETTEISNLNSIQTNLGDVLAEALQKKNDREKGAETVANRKNTKKKTKKMTPLYTTGINYGGNS